ncbi:MAG: 6-bladed beta-propeller [Cytophagales bacterium]|nr:6-bladed beta-propeller [Cytophagales bacterium]
MPDPILINVGDVGANSLHSYFEVDAIPLETSDNLLAQISRLEVFSERYYILDDKKKTVSIYGDEGEYLGIVGSRGTGPGEYLMPTDLQADKDGIHVLDNRSISLISYDHDGQFLSAMRFRDQYPQYFRKLGLNYATYVGFNSDTHNLKILDANSSLVQELFPYDQENYPVSFAMTGGLREGHNGLLYSNVADPNIYFLNESGNPYKKYTFDFGSTTWPEGRKEDIDAFIASMHEFKTSFLSEQFYENRHALAFGHADPKGGGFGIYLKQQDMVLKKFSLDETWTNYLIGPIGVDQDGFYFYINAPRKNDTKKANALKDENSRVYQDLIGKSLEENNPTIIYLKIKETLL